MAVGKHNSRQSCGECPNWHCRNPGANCKDSSFVRCCLCLSKYRACVTRCSSQETASRVKTDGVTRCWHLHNWQLRRFEWSGSDRRVYSDVVQLRGRARARAYCCNSSGQDEVRETLYTAEPDQCLARVRVPRQSSTDSYKESVGASFR